MLYDMLQRYVMQHPAFCFFCYVTFSNAMYACHMKRWHDLGPVRISLHCHQWPIALFYMSLNGIIEFAEIL